MSDDEFLEAAANAPDALKLYNEHGTCDFEKTIAIANILQDCGAYGAASLFFQAAFDVNPTSPSVLLAKLKAQILNGQSPDREQIGALKRLDPSHGDFLEITIASKAERGEPQTKDLLRRLGRAVEAFYTGAEPDWLYLRMASPLMQISERSASRVSPIPRTLFMYWDRDLPQFASDNLAFHRDLSYFDVEFYDKERTVAFLYDYFGADCCATFKRLRHASEESDFFRWHAVYAFGGYYLDMDNQLISKAAFDEVAVSSRSTVFFLSASGPIESCFFGATKHAAVLDECLRILMYNCFHNHDLSMWLKTGPGVATRAMTRLYHRALFKGDRVPDVWLREEHVIAGVLRELSVDYRNDARDWRVFERQTSH